MDGFACSSWYFLRFVSPHYPDGPFDPAALAHGNAWASRTACTTSRGPCGMQQRLPRKP